MRKREIKDLIKIASGLHDEATRMHNWCIENKEKFWHLEIDKALGDEGWTKLFEYQGASSAYLDACGKILKFIKTNENHK